MNPEGTIADATKGRYQIERGLGHGGMASVFLGRDESLNRPVAIKLLADHLAGDEEFRERFMHEAQLAAGLSHPNIVNVFDVGEVDGQPFIVMEYVDGESLAEVIDRGGLGEDESVQVMLQACAGMRHAHEAGLIHRDIKPPNLLLRKDGTLKIVDFGIARAAEGTGMTKTGLILGTRGYVAPEVEAGEEPSAASDLYALGVVLADLVGDRAGRRVKQIVARCTHENPRKRYASAATLRNQLMGMKPLADESPGLLARLRPARPVPSARPRTRGHADSATALLAESSSSTKESSARISSRSTARSKGHNAAARATAWWKREADRDMLPRIAAVTGAIVVLLIGIELLTVVAFDGGGAEQAANGAEQAANSPEQGVGSGQELGNDDADRARELADWLRQQAP